jgi:hypothetical protein
VFDPGWVSLYCLCISWGHLCVIVQMVCLFGLISNESWVRSSFWCLECVVHMYLRCFLGVRVFLCWAVEYVSLEVYFPLIGFGSGGCTGLLPRTRMSRGSAFGGMVCVLDGP